MRNLLICHSYDVIKYRIHGNSEILYKRVLAKSLNHIEPNHKRLKTCFV